MNDIYYELNDIADTLRFSDGESEYSRNDLEVIEERLDLLYRLSKKYGSTEEEMLEFLSEAEDKLNSLTSSEENLEILKEQRKEILEKACIQTYKEFGEIQFLEALREAITKKNYNMK